VKRTTLAASTGLLAIILAAAWSIAGAGADLGPREQSEKPQLALLTSLPLIFGEGFGIDLGGSPALTRLEERYVVSPIAVADSPGLKGQSLLLMAHPRAQPAEVLVELDQWVRSGGHVLILADPRLDWPSERPLGDLLRPPPAFADTGLLAHWGVRLIGPVAEGIADRQVGGVKVVTSSPGRLESRSCEVIDGFVARCRVGKGEAVVIADADFIDAEHHGIDNLDLLIAELDRLETH
jgi:hypothetical protein